MKVFTKGEKEEVKEERGERGRDRERRESWADPSRQ